MLKYTLIFLLTLGLLVFIFADEFDDYESSAEMENVKITDVLKMIVIPPANEMKEFLTPGNDTKSPDPSKLDFILQAIEYWRKHNMEEPAEDELGNDNNATIFTFNLRDDFFDKDGATYSHLSKKLQNKRGGGSNFMQNDRTRRSQDKEFVPLPYIYVKNLYVNDKTRKNKGRSGIVRKRNNFAKVIQQNEGH